MKIQYSEFVVNRSTIFVTWTFAFDHWFLSYLKYKLNTP